MSVIESVEMLWLWLQGLGLREVARLSGTDRKTVRRYVDRARRADWTVTAARIS